MTVVLLILTAPLVSQGATTPLALDSCQVESVLAIVWVAMMEMWSLCELWRCFHVFAQQWPMQAH